LPNPRESKKQSGYLNIFNDLGADWEAIVDERDTQKEVDFIQDMILRKGLTLDLCCGTGRHAVILRKKAWNIIGMDLSRNLLKIAKLRMKEAEVSFQLVRADMRYFPFKNKVFCAIMNMFTSFGYLPSLSEDVKSLLEVYRTLKNGGSFLLDVANRDHVIKNFQEKAWAEFKPFYLIENRVLDLKKSKLISQWAFIKKDNGKRRLIQHILRLYTFSQIEMLFKEAGLIVKEVYGGYENQEFNLDASRMIVHAQRIK